MNTPKFSLCALAVAFALPLCASTASVADRVLTIALDAHTAFSAIDEAVAQVDSLKDNTITNVTVTGAYRLTADTALTGYTGTWTITEGSLYATASGALGTGKITMASRGVLEFGVSDATWANEIEFTDPNYGNQTTAYSGKSGVNLCFAKATTLTGNITAAGNLDIRTDGCNAKLQGTFSSPNGTIRNHANHEGCTVYFQGKVTVKSFVGTTADSATAWFQFSHAENNIQSLEAYYGQLNFTGKNCSTNSVWRQGYSEYGTSCRGRIQLTADQWIDRLTWPNGSEHPETGAKSQTMHLINFSGGVTLTMRGTQSDHSDVRLTGIGNFLWAPLDKSFTYTFERSRYQDLQGWWAVSNGVLKVIGTPTFPKLTAIDIQRDGTFDFDVTTGDEIFTTVTTLSVGKNGRADFKDFQPFAKMSDLIIRMDSTGFLTMKPGTYAPLKLFLDGTQVGGLFTGLNGTAEGATKVAWLDDDVVIDAPEVEIESVPRTWDAGGDTTLVGNPCNWDGDTKPDFAAGSLLATFASGMEASFNEAVNAKGLVFSTSKFTFAPLSGGSLKVGEEGIAVNSGTFSNDVPLAVSRNQTWTTASGSTMTMTAPLLNDGTTKRTVTFNGPGKLLLTGRGAESDFTGDFNLYGGEVTLKGEDPFGPPSADGKSKVQMQYLNNALKVHFNGTKITKPLVFAGDSVTWDVSSGVTNEFAGPVTLTGTHRPTWNGGILVFSGGLTVSGTVVPSYGHTMIFRNKRCYFDGQWQDGGGTVICECPSNYIWANTYYIPGNKYWLKAPYALCWDNGNGTYKYSNFEMSEGRRGAGTFELCGYPQTIGEWYMDATTQDRAGTYFINSSATPSDLHMIQNRKNGDNYATNQWLNDFKGRINLYKEGLATAMITNVAVSAKGEIHVVQGRLTFSKGATWKGATNVTVAAGAKLGVYEPTTFTKKTTVALPDETGAMTLDNASPLTVRSVAVGGENLPKGLYCAPDAGVAGATEHTVFAGKGAIFVRGCRGFAVTIQ